MKLKIRFADQSTSFTHGVEYGRLLQKMEQGDAVISNNDFPVREENVELLKETCGIEGYIPVFSPSIVEGWVEFVALKKTYSDS